MFPKYVGFFVASGAAESQSTATNPLVAKTTVRIDGMTCEACAVALEKTIQEVPGVLSTRVNYQHGEAVVSTEACCAFPKDEILSAIRDAGFVGRVADTK